MHVGKFEIIMWTLLMLVIGMMIGFYGGVYLETIYPNHAFSSQVTVSERK